MKVKKHNHVKFLGLLVFKVKAQLRWVITDLIRTATVENTSKIIRRHATTLRLPCVLVALALSLWVIISGRLNRTDTVRLAIKLIFILYVHVRGCITHYAFLYKSRLPALLFPSCPIQQLLSSSSNVFTITGVANILQCVIFRIHLVWNFLQKNLQLQRNYES